MQDSKKMERTLRAIRASELIVKQYTIDLTHEELAELNSWIGESPENLKLYNEMVHKGHMRKDMEALSQYDVLVGHSNLLEKISNDQDLRGQLDVEILHQDFQQESYPAPRPRVVPINFFRRYAAAVILILVIGGSIWWYWKNNTASRSDDKPIFAQLSPKDILPGSKKARLVLADGQIVEIDKADSTFSTESGTQVTIAKGNVSYKGATGNNEAAYHTLIVPRGAEYSLWLDDGTRVWLNAASSLHYPAKFTGKERTVMLTGEGYFQVAEDKSRPFHVSVNNLDVKVLGTEFNINSYSDEAVIRATLFKGAVHVSGDKISFDLKPGQQLQTNVNGQAKVVNADLEATAAWKNGVFSLSGADVPTIMRQILRWYDLEQVVYPANFDSQSIHISGTFPKNATLDEVLEVLAINGVRFRLDNKKLIMLSK